MPYCPFCGSEISEEDTFCGACGAMLNGTPQGTSPKGPNYLKVIALLLVISVVLAGVGGAVLFGLFELGNKIDGEDITRTYTWEYIRGDDHKSFSYSLTVEKEYYDRMVSSPIDRSGTSSADRYVNNGKTVFAVGDYVVVDEYIRKVSDDLQALYKAQFGDFSCNDDYVNFVTAFVQICIEYDYDESNLLGEYWRYPLETLCDGKGDCEDTSILLAALIDAKGLNGGVILVPGHAMCAIASSDLTNSYENQRHSSVYDRYFYPIETTYNSFYTIGEISSENEVRYLHLYMGSVADYYFSS